MANIYYVDHGGSNTAPYDTQAKAAPALAIILAIPPAAGDIIYCCDNAGVGETTAAVLSCASSGTNAAGYIKVIGCNSSGIVDGTRYVIDANGGDYDIIDLVGKDLWWFENIEVHNNGGATQHGFYTSTSGTTGCVHINCCAHNCTGSGFDENNQGTGTFVRCCSYSNTADGFAVASYTRMVFCVARDNTADGFGGGSGFSGVVYGCVSHGNGDDGFGAVQAAANLIGCVADGNTDDGIEIGTGSSLYSALVLGCRVTNQSGAGDIGLNCNSEPAITGWNYFEDNADNIANDAIMQFIPLEGGSATSNLEDLANTNEGYVDKTNHDFSTNYVDAGDPDLRRTAITLPWS